MAEPTEEQQITAALIGERYRRQYLTDPGFHAKLDLLVRMLPEWVEGMAAASDAEADRRAAMIAAMERGTFQAGG